MRNKRFLYIALMCAAAGSAWVFGSISGVAQQNGGYVGPEKCADCHPDVVETWMMTTHRRTLFNEDPSKKGCEGCHGPGENHVESGGDPEVIIRPERLKPEETAAICMKCHTQEEITMWPTSQHARARLTCVNCHDSHSPTTDTLTQDVESARLEVEGFSRSIKQAELDRNNLAAGSPEHAAAADKVAELKVERDRLLKSLTRLEDMSRRTSESYQCFTCHKAQEVQSRMPSHHPIVEGKMECSDCHNPHGGPGGMLREESVGETCFRCHAEKLGPFVYDHPPVTEDCTTCHRPHGSVQNSLLAQSEPFLCLRCHPAPHNRSNTLGDPKMFASYYTECTDCHTQPHGSDTHGALHY